MWAYDLHHAEVQFPRNKLTSQLVCQEKNATVVSRLVTSQIELCARHKGRNAARVEGLGTF